MSSPGNGGAAGNQTHTMDLPDALPDALLRTLGVPRPAGPVPGVAGRPGDAAANASMHLRPLLTGGQAPHLPWYLLSDYAALREHSHDAPQAAGGAGGAGWGGGDLGGDVVEFLHQYYVPAIILMGLVGNLLSCVVFLNTHLRLRSSSYYLAALASADFGYLAVLVLVWLDNVHGVQVFDKEGWCQMVTYVSSVCAFVSVWLIVAFTVERFIAVQYPLHRPHMCTVARAKAIVLCIAVFGVVAHIYTLMTRGIVNKDGYESCEMLDQHRSVMRVINLVDAIVTLVVPVVLIIVMNTMITRNLVLFGRRFKQAGSVDGADTTANSWADGQLGAESCDSRSSNAPSGRRRPPGGVAYAIKVSGPGPQRGPHAALRSAGHKVGSALGPATQDTNAAPEPPDVTLCLGPGLGHKPAAATLPPLPSLPTATSPHYATPARSKQQAIPIYAGRTLVSTRTQQSITKMLLLISSVFIVLNLPSHVLRVYASVAVFTGTNMAGTSSLMFGQHIAMLLYYTNFSINFLLYSMCGITFRRCLWQLVRSVGRYFGCGCGSRWAECQFR